MNSFLMIYRGTVLKKALVIIGVCLIFLGSFSSGYILGLGPFFIWETEIYRVPMSLFSDYKIIRYDSFEAKSFNLETGEELIISFEVTNYTKLEDDIIDITENSGNVIDFFVLDKENFIKWKNGEETINHFYAHRLTSVSPNITIPYENNWTFVLDNTFTNTETKELLIDVDIITILPFHGDIVDRFPTFVFFSVIIIFFGILLVVFGLLKKNCSNSKSYDLQKETTTSEKLI